MLRLVTQGGQVRRFSVKFSENFDGRSPIPSKPRIRDFRYPLANTFLIASATFMGLNALWYGLEYRHVEKELIEESLALETELQTVLDNARDEMIKSQRPWYSKFKFWNK